MMLKLVNVTTGYIFCLYGNNSDSLKERCRKEFLSLAKKNQFWSIQSRGFELDSNEGYFSYSKNLATWNT